MTAPIYRAVIFDCDGVMFDTREANRAFYNRMLSQFDQPLLTEEQFQFVQAHTVFESIDFLFRESGYTDAAMTYREQMSYDPFLPRMEMEPHLKPLLRALRPACRTAVATNRTDTMGRVLEVFDLEKYFDMVVCALDVPHPKPAPDCLVKILWAFSLPPGEALYIGDSLLDLQAARSAGVDFAAYENTGLDADYHIDRLDTIQKICLP
jgi:HAD superfamily hydrolase (TIGR01509 family)